MKIDHFRYFVTIDRLGSISAAAKYYNIRQSTLSAIVKQAEEEFGFSVFLRTPDGVMCTPQGKEFIKRAKEIDIGYGQILSIQKQVKGKASVRIIMDPVTCGIMAMPLTDAFYQTKSRGNVRIFEEETEALIDALGNGTAKIALFRLDGITRTLMEKNQFTKDMVLERMAWDELCVMVSDQHSLALKEILEVSDLEGEILICHQAMEKEVFRFLGKELGRHLRVHCHEEKLYEAVAQKGMTAVISRFSAEQGNVWKRPGVRMLRLVNPQKENRQELVLAYCEMEMCRERCATMSKCIRSYFRQREKWGIKE